MIISKSTIDKVFEAARVEEVIGDFVTLKKAGSNYKTLSPFSDEKTPSFMVSPAKQIWKDFSTGKGGNSVSFLMEHEHYSYPEAIVYLAKKYNIEVERVQQTDEQKQADNLRESLYLVLEFAQKYYSESLWKNEKGKAIGLSYCKERGFTDETIKTFKLGYNIDQWGAFTNTALQKGFQLEFLEKTGLTIVKNNNKFDRFKGRILFPIQSISGRVLGFGGRILKEDKKAAKYLNSPESDIYHKSKILYGLYQAKQNIIKQDVCYLVEGYTDVISLHQKGVKNVVASSGTALTREQIGLIKRFTSNITLLFDGDTAGINAAMRGIDLVLEQGMNVKVVMFPNGQDPDSFARSVSEQDLTIYIEEKSEDFIRFKTTLLMEQIKNDPIKKGALIRDIVSSIAKIPSDIQKEVYVQSCSKILKISENVLFRELAQIVQKNIEQLRKSQYHLSQKEQKPTQILEEKPIENIENNSLEFCEREILKYYYCTQMKNLFLRIGKENKKIIRKNLSKKNIEPIVLKRFFYNYNKMKLHLVIAFFKKFTTLL